MSGPTERQWAVSWPPHDSNNVEAPVTEDTARYVARLYRTEGARLVSRTVTYGEWEDAT